MDCTGHQKEQLAHVLQFMYFKRKYPLSVSLPKPSPTIALTTSPTLTLFPPGLRSEYDGAYLNLADPLDGESIRRNAYMFVCGSSVDCRSMMDFATDGIDETTQVMECLMPTLYQSRSLARFHEPLRDALAILFDQGDRPLALTMRLALACLADVTLMYLVLNPAFRVPYETTWCPWIALNCLRDNARFKAMGWLDPVRDGEVSSVRTAMEMMSIRADAAGDGSKVGAEVGAEVVEEVGEVEAGEEVEEVEEVEEGKGVEKEKEKEKGEEGGEKEEEEGDGPAKGAEI